MGVGGWFSVSLSINEKHPQRNGGGGGGGPIQIPLGFKILRDSVRKGR